MQLFITAYKSKIGEVIMTTLKILGAGIGAGLGYIFGGMDSLLLFLIILSVIDIVTGLIKAVYNKDLNSDITLKGLCRKAGIYVIVAVCHLADQALGLTVLRDGAIGFYAVMEMVSITENWGAMELPLPQQLKNVLAQLNKENSAE